MKIAERIAEQLDTAQKEIQNILRVKTFIDSLSEQVRNELPEGYVFGEKIDFDNLPHADVIRVIQLLGGKWTKTPGEDAKIHYETTINGVNVRCYSGEPPANCKIVEEQITIPAQPEKQVTRRRLVCVEPVQVEAAST
jgi:hypothetical protein